MTYSFTVLPGTTAVHAASRGGVLPAGTAAAQTVATRFLEDRAAATKSRG